MKDRIFNCYKADVKGIKMSATVGLVEGICCYDEICETECDYHSLRQKTSKGGDT